jgi:hypothetical protein
MRKPPLPGKDPFSQRGSTSAGNDPRGPGSLRFGAPVLDASARRGEGSGEASAPAGNQGFRSAILRDRSGASGGLGSTDRPGAAFLGPRPAPGAGPTDEEQSRWLKSWQANEIRWLNTKVEDLERQLRWRTIVSVGAVALGGLAVIAAVAFGMVSPQLPEAVIAEIETTPSGGPPLAARSTGEPDQVPVAAPSQTDPTPAPAEPAVGEPAEPQPWGREQAPAIGSSQTDRAMIPGAPVAVEPGQDVGLSRSEAEQALMTIIEPGSASGPPGEPERAAEIRPPPSEEARAATPLNGVGEDDPSAEAERVGGLETVGQTSPGAAARGDYYTATASVNLRDGPGTAAEVVTVVDPGGRVRRLGSEGDWLLVEYDNRGTGMVRGWVHRGFLRHVESPS